ncbi:MAG: TetR/AcrR family transcriptional regulator [Bacteroides sp.]|jgi:AcrR family transcriptional regulator|nr:TetR/AcrR family transcriptional regulator [Bacteroides sp.]
MKKTSRKYTALVSSAKDLFWKHGFKRVSVEEICHTALVSKMTFYRYFANKTELAKAVFDQVVDDAIGRFKGIMADDQTNAMEKMQQILQMKLEGTNDISPEFLQDFYSSPELGLSSHIEKKTHQVWEEIIKDFKLGQQKGWFRKDFKPEAFFVISTKISEMLSSPELLNLYDNPQELVMELTKLFTFGIVPGEGNEKPSE